MRKIRLLVYLLKRKYLFIFWTIKCEYLLRLIKRQKECYISPFTGEFGHLLGHYIPFIYYLYTQKVNVHFCGLKIHRPFFTDNNGNSIVFSYTELRDFYIESNPSCNSAELPNDVRLITDSFCALAKKSKYKYVDLTNMDFYFDFFRWWIIRKGFVRVPDLYFLKDGNKSRTNSLVIFPRKMKLSCPDELRNNGEIWDYEKIASIATKYFEKIYVIGHPNFSDVPFQSSRSIEIILTNDNNIILEKCAESRLIITPHSGAVYIGEYVKIPILIIYKGNKTIGNIDITERIKYSLGNNSKWHFSFDYNEIKDYLENFTSTLK